LELPQHIVELEDVISMCELFSTIQRRAISFFQWVAVHDIGGSDSMEAR
jgi:hypothetical protein